MIKGWGEGASISNSASNGAPVNGSPFNGIQH
jgi:hypothetical protein